MSTEGPRQAPVSRRRSGLALACLVGLGLFGCSDGKKKPSSTEPAACVSDDDCAEGHCDAGECVECRSDRDCASSARCVEQACQAKDVCTLDSCRKPVCEPESWSCDETYATAQLCSADGLTIAQTVDCAEEGKVCENGECQTKICEPDATRCDGNSIATCGASGASEDQTLCASDERCEADTAKCVPLECEAGTKGCLEETIATCKGDGSGYEPSGEDCAAAEQACWEGSCEPIVCQTGFTCVDGSSYECRANRTQLELAQACTTDAGQFCNVETGKCQDFVCEPTKPACNGDLATSCAPDGSHPLDIGVDCAAAGKVCWAAECIQPICEPDTYSCDGSKLELCVNKGTSLEITKTCGAGRVCDAAAGTCRLQKCEPDQPACDGDVAATCDATGLGYTGSAEDCAADGKVCVAGECRLVICTPDAAYCVDGELRQCNSNGGASTLLDACLPSEYCDAGRAVCAADECTAGTTLCDGNVLTKCADDGSGPLPGGTDCGASNMVCDRAACRALVCTPNARSCEDGNVVLCNGVGTDVAPYDTCRTREFCDAAIPRDATCSPDLCPQKGLGCQGEHLAVCNDDGSGFASTGTDCSLSAKVCDFGGVCLPTALDELGVGGAARPSGGSAIHFELFSVLTPRRLLQLEAGVQLDAPGSVTWVVYHSPTRLGIYTLITQATTAGTITNGYASSGSLDVSLTQGDYYLFGIAVKGTHSASVLEGNAPFPVSFGQQLGGFTYNAGAVPTIAQQLEVSAGLLSDDVALRLTTSLP